VGDQLILDMTMELREGMRDGLGVWLWQGPWWLVDLQLAELDTLVSGWTTNNRSALDGLYFQPMK
jgi:hypothetical protein